jgi:hypothetical protein
VGRFNAGGDSATGLGGFRVVRHRHMESCDRNGKWITSGIAIVAPQTCDFGQGRAGVTALARPDYSGNLCDFLPPPSLALAKVFSFVSLNFGNVLCGPAPMLTTVHADFFRRGNFPFRLPTEQGHPVNSCLSRRFFRRIRLHLSYTPITYVVK